jgi:heme oxygenase
MILTRLREHTRSAHERLESRACILEQTANLGDYKRLVSAFYGFYQPIELSLAAVIMQELPDFDFDPRRKVRLLENDFSSLCIDVTQFDKCGVCCNLPVLRTAPQALGCLYVLEGSTLGGKIISTYVRDSLGIDAANGAAFFNSYGSNVGVMWSAFGRQLSCYSETHSEDRQILESALATFISLERWLLSS